MIGTTQLSDLEGKQMVWKCGTKMMPSARASCVVWQHTLQLTGLRT